MSNILSTLSGIVFVLAFIPYLRAIWRGETKPVIITWALWLSLNVIFGFQMYNAGTLNYQIVGAIAGSTLVLILSFWYGERTWSREDVYRSIGAAIALSTWLVSGSATIGMIVTTIVLIGGAIPTFMKAWDKPEEEDKLAWAMFFTSCVLQLLSLWYQFQTPVWNWPLEDSLQPLSFTFIETVMVYILFIAKRKP